MFGDKFCFCKKEEGTPEYDRRGKETKEKLKKEPKKEKSRIMVFWRKIFGISDYKSKEWCDDRDKETERNKWGLPYLDRKKESKDICSPHNDVLGYYPP